MELQFLQKIYLVSWESNADGNTSTNFYPCTTQEIAKAFLKQCREKVFSEGHFADIDPTDDDFGITESATEFFIQDYNDNYWEEITISVLDIIDSLPQKTKMEKIVSDYKNSYLIFRNQIKEAIGKNTKKLIPTDGEESYHTLYETDKGSITCEVSHIRVKKEETTEHFEFYTQKIGGKFRGVWCAEFDFPPHEVEEMLQRIIW